MPLDLFRSQYVRYLCRNVEQNLARYSERKHWATKGVDIRTVRLDTTLEPSIPLELELPDGNDLKDLENTKIVYSAFPNLTPVQARDPRLWTRLTHIECWPYMRKRWDVSRQKGDDAKRQRYVLQHYFVTQNQSRMLLRNGIARLWWYGHLTHDSSRSNPYELTAVLLSSLDTAQQLLERNMGRAPCVRTAFLEFLSRNATHLGGTSGQRRDQVRALAKSLNLRGGLTILDCLSTSDVDSILSEEITKSAAL
jgi:hypothetical protein